MKPQNAALKKQQEAETSNLHKITTVIYRFEKDQVSQNPPEACGKIPETAAVLAAIKLNAIMKRRRNAP